MGYTLEFPEFAVQHGGVGSAIETDQQGGKTLLFPDGAQASLHWNGWSFTDPPTNDYGRLSLQRHYAALQCSQAENDFAALKNALKGHGTFHWPDNVCYGPSSRDGLTDLEKIKAAVTVLRKNVAELDAAIALTPEHLAQQRHEREIQLLKDEQARNEHAYIQRVHRVTLDSPSTNGNGSTAIRGQHKGNGMTSNVNPSLTRR